MIRSYEKDKRVERAKVIRAIRDKLDRDREKYLESRRQAFQSYHT
jgi:hypothetical protein